MRPMNGHALAVLTMLMRLNMAVENLPRTSSARTEKSPESRSGMCSGVAVLCYWASFSTMSRNGSSSGEVAGPQILIRACHVFSTRFKSFSAISFVAAVGVFTRQSVVGGCE